MLQTSLAAIRDTAKATRAAIDDVEAGIDLLAAGPTRQT
jgi:hypothetical protein